MSTLETFLKKFETSVDEETIVAIARRVTSSTADIDLVALRNDLCALKANAPHPRTAPSERRRQAAKIKQHAQKLFDAYCSTDGKFFREWFNAICNPVDDKYLERVEAFVVNQRACLIFLIHLTQASDKIIAAANEEILAQNRSKNDTRCPELAAIIREATHPPQDASSIIAFKLAPIYERHFHKRATTSTPAETASDRTPRGPFVRFVQAIQEHLRIFPDLEQVSPHTIATALNRTKNERKKRAEAEAAAKESLQSLQGELRKIF